MIAVMAGALITLTSLMNFPSPLTSSTASMAEQFAATSALAAPQSTHPFHPFYNLQRNRLEVFDELATNYLRPWIPMPGGPRPVTLRMLDTMESIYRGAAFRVRVLNNTLLYRHTVWWSQTYRLERMNWWLKFIQLLLDEGRITDNLDIVLSMSDAPRVGSDSLSQGKDGSAGFPLFAMHASVLHVDIPIVDSVVFGSNGKYVWDEEAKAFPWADKQALGIFRGSASCFMMHVDNWHSCPRVIAAQMSKQYPELMDIQLIKWNQVSDKIKELFPAPTEAEVEATTNLTLAKPMTFLEQAHYKYLVDIDGGAGSSRKPVRATTSTLTASHQPYTGLCSVGGLNYLLVRFSCLPAAVLCRAC